jgi:hypothetical protein
MTEFTERRIHSLRTNVSLCHFRNVNMDNKAQLDRLADALRLEIRDSSSSETKVPGIFS